jgi:hypothetical protein
MSKTPSTFVPDKPPAAAPGVAPVGDTPGGPWSTPSPTPPPSGPGYTEPAKPFSREEKQSARFAQRVCGIKGKDTKVCSIIFGQRGARISDC